MERMVMVPEGQISHDVEEPLKPGPKKKDPELMLITKLWRAVRIAIKLLAVGAINSDGYLLDHSGEAIQNADLISLIHFAVSRGKARYGEDKFVQALRLAKIPPEWITNEDIKMKYLSYQPMPTRKRTLGI
ncbi:hypothetical protein HDE_02634 [Halotydeus destructor]|nr:hypothetical protein HDE_02634 [Halotydeus destructor]